MPNTREPYITVNGVALTDAQAMSVRVACTSFLTEMSDPNVLGTDAIGKSIVSEYRDRIQEVVSIMVG